MKYLGVVILLIGLLLLIWAGFQPSYDSNLVLGSGLLLVVGGYVAHILLGKRFG